MRRALFPLLALAATIVQSGSPTASRAACYEDVGCTDSDRYSWRELRSLASCQVLWEMRNGIFHENGYCFEGDRALDLFGNAGCRYRRMTQLPLNSAEKHNIAAIQRAERAKGC